MKNTRDCYKKLSEDRSLLANEIQKIPGSAKYYLEFYRLVLVVSLSLVYRGSTRKGASTLRYCSNYSPLIGGGMEVDILPPSLPSRWIKSPGGSQIKSIKSFSRIYLEKYSSRFHSAAPGRYQQVLQQHSVLAPLLVRASVHQVQGATPVQKRTNGQTNKRTVINYSWKTQGILIKIYQKKLSLWDTKYWKFQVIRSITWNFIGWYWSWVSA